MMAASGERAASERASKRASKRARERTKKKMEGYSAQDVTRMLGVTPGRLRAYVRAGLVTAERGEGGRLRFSFQDLLLLRTAEGLVAERIRPRRVVQAFRKLRDRLPEASPLTGVQLAADGGDVIVRDGGSRWRPESGQFLLAFPDGTPPPLDSPVAAFARPTPAPELPELASALTSDLAETRALDGPGSPSAAVSADDLYQIACTLEETDPVHATHTYRQVLALDPGHADAHVNLGRLLHEAGELVEAEAHYRVTLNARPDDATAAFNLAVAIEDQGRYDEALVQYERAVEIDGKNPDAHYNAARLYEKIGKYTAAIRHLRAYRELVR
jgi:TPR repeat/MerR HTH family regulatory protein/Tetratricopeptide repeat